MVAGPRQLQNRAPEIIITGLAPLLRLPNAEDENEAVILGHVECRRATATIAAANRDIQHARRGNVAAKLEHGGKPTEAPLRLPNQQLLPGADGEGPEGRGRAHQVLHAATLA